MPRSSWVTILPLPGGRCVRWTKLADRVEVVITGLPGATPGRRALRVFVPRTFDVAGVRLRNLMLVAARPALLASCCSYSTAGFRCWCSNRVRSLHRQVARIHYAAVSRCHCARCSDDELGATEQNSTMITEDRAAADRGAELPAGPPPELTPG